MKKTILSLAFILFTGILFAQTLSKGNVIALRIYHFELLPDVTAEQVDSYLAEQSIDFNSSFDDIKLFFVKGLRGENENEIAGIIYMDSDEIRDKYFTDIGVTETGQLLLENFEDVVAGLQEFVTPESATQLFTASDYTDWEIQ